MDGLVPLSHVRQKVQVMYRDYLEDPEAFKKQPDSFVFHQVRTRMLSSRLRRYLKLTILDLPSSALRCIDCLYTLLAIQIYDRFMHKPFDLIPTSQVMNAPGVHSDFS